MSGRGPNQRAVRRGLSGDPADIAFQTNLAAGEQPQRIGIDAVLDGEDTRRQRLRRIVIGNRDRALHHDRSRIGFRDHEMHGRA